MSWLQGKKREGCSFEADSTGHLLASNSWLWLRWSGSFTKHPERTYARNSQTPNTGVFIFRVASTTEALDKDTRACNVSFQPIFPSYLQREDRFSPHLVCTSFLSFRDPICSLGITASLCLLLTTLRSLGSDIPPENFIFAELLEASLMKWRSRSLQLDLESGAAEYGSNICKWLCIARWSSKHFPLLLLHSKRSGAMNPSFILKPPLTTAVLLRCERGSQLC